MIATIRKSVLSGVVDAISSKSYCHRHILAAALSDREVRLVGVGDSADIDATIEAVRAIGATVSRNADNIVITPAAVTSKSIAINMQESGSTLRFMLPILAARGIHAEITGEGRLPERTIKPIVELMTSQGLIVSSSKLPLDMHGKIVSGHYPIAGNISSQFISGLIMALPLLDGNSDIELTTPLESRQYVDMTIEVLARYGIEISTTDSGYHIAGGQRYSASGTMVIEKDWSNASPWLVIGAIVGDITVCGLNMHSAQGDRVMVELLRSMGADIRADGDKIIMSKSTLKAIDCSVRDCPDLAPMIALAMANCSGTSRIYDTDRLVIKESDRRSAIIETLVNAGIDARYDMSTGAIIINGGALRAGKYDGHNDHRIVMLASAIGLLVDGVTEVIGCEAINKSYKSFYDAIRSVNGNVEIR